jgi:hypothetical protein
MWWPGAASSRNLLKIYAHCIDGQADAANQRITGALGTQPEPGDEGEGDDVDLRITEKPVYDILPGRPEARLDDDAQLNPDGSGHQPDQGMLKVGGEILACWLAEDHGYARRRVNDKASAALRLKRRLRQLGRPASS